jgi:hypothetical protein
MEHYLVTIWLVYGIGATGLTYLVARALQRHGAVFLQALFSGNGNGELARAVSGLLVLGFYVLSLGYAALLLGSADLGRVHTGADAAVLLVDRLGLLLVSLGVIHFLVMWIFYRLGSRGALRLGAPAPMGTGGAGRMGSLEPEADAAA